MTRTTIVAQVMAFAAIATVYAANVIITGKPLWLIILEPFL